MRISIDTGGGTVEVEDEAGSRSLDLYGKEAFEVLSQLWLKTSWNIKYPYTFTWMGRPVIQHPEDMLRMQEAIYTLRPDVIIETGVAHGGSLVFYASLFAAMGKGRVVGIDVDIRPHNRAAIEGHELFSYITLVEGNSVDPDIVAEATRNIGDGDTVMVILDSDHSLAHVEAELEAYHPFVTPGSYLVATDGIMRDVYDVPRGRPEWRDDNPAAAAEAFQARHPEFVIKAPTWRFNESSLDHAITAWPSAWLKRRG